jgi:hypothetical protein
LQTNQVELDSISIQKKFPYPKGFQSNVLSLLVRDMSFLRDYGYDIVNPELFDDWYHATICAWIQKHFLSYGVPPTETALNLEAQQFCEKEGFSKDVFENFLSYIREICESDIGSLEFVKNKVCSFVREQTFRNALELSKPLIEEGNFEAVANLLMKAATVGFDRKLGLNFLEHAKDLPALYRKRFGKEVSVPTGFPTLDWCLKGGMKIGGLYSFVAPPGSGKSFVLCCIAANALQLGYEVAYYTLEIPEEEVLYRICSNFTGMTFEQITDPQYEGIYREKIEKFLSLKKNILIKHFPPNSVNIQSIRSHLSRAHAMLNFNPVLVIIDYADLLLPMDKQTGFLYEDKGNIYYDLIKLAEEYSCPVATASQPAKEYWRNDVLGKGCMANSSMKEAVAHACISLNQTDEEKKNGSMRMIPFKVRNGVEDRVIYCKKNLQYSSIREDDRMNQIFNSNKEIG